MLHLRVKKDRGEEVRQRLLKENVLDREHKILEDKNFLYFPLWKKIKSSQTKVVDRKGEKIKAMERKTLRDLLSNKLTAEELKLLPRAFDVVGDILILELDERLEGKGKEIGKALLGLYKNVKVVLNKKSERKGEFRTRNFKILTGDGKTETVHKEYGCEFKLDVRKVYFSPREAQERQRIAKKVKDNEEVLVVFSGIAPFAIQIAKLNPSCKITCVEKNPEAVKYAEENLRLNKVGDKVKNICEDIREVGKKFLIEGKKFDRVLMPLPKEAHHFLELAIPLLKNRGILHFYHWAREEDLFSEAEDLVKIAAKKFDREVKILEKRKVLPYAPRTWKVVLDVEIE